MICKLIFLTLGALSDSAEVRFKSKERPEVYSFQLLIHNSNKINCVAQTTIVVVEQN